MEGEGVRAGRGRRGSGWEEGKDSKQQWSGWSDGMDWGKAMHSSVAKLRNLHSIAFFLSSALALLRAALGKKKSNGMEGGDGGGRGAGREGKNG